MKLSARNLKLDISCSLRINIDNDFAWRGLAPKFLRCHKSTGHRSASESKLLHIILPLLKHEAEEEKLKENEEQEKQLWKQVSQLSKDDWLDRHAKLRRDRKNTLARMNRINKRLYRDNEHLVGKSPEMIAKWLLADA
jgi:hypothetical protein